MVLTPAKDHSHEWPMHKLNEVQMCKAKDCTHMAVCIAGDGGRRDLTPREQAEATILMWEDIIMVQAMQLIHGDELGMKKYLYLTGRGPAA